jgi:hypothetical protein
MTPLGIESATFRFVSQCLNQLRQRVPAYCLLSTVSFCKTAHSLHLLQIYIDVGIGRDWNETCATLFLSDLQTAFVEGEKSAARSGQLHSEARTWVT